MEKKNLATLILLVAGLSAILLLVMGGKMSAANARIIAIVFSCILLWATAVIPGLLVSLLFFFLSTLLTPVPTAQIFSGFASSAFWLVFSGSAIGFALKESGLSDRIGIALAQWIGGSYLKALTAFAILTFLLSLVMPSTFSRIAILVPIALGYCDAVHLAEHSNGRRGILMLVIVGSYELAAAVLPANLPNVIMTGILEQSQGIHLTFSEYLLYFLPAGVIVRGAILITVSYKLFSDSVHETVRLGAYTRISGREAYVIVLLSITLIFWFADSIHHIAPGWIGLGFTLVYFLTSPAEQLTRFTHILKMDLLWFIAAIIGLTALVQHLDMQLLSLLGSATLMGNPALTYAMLIASSVCLCLLVTSNAAPALFIPLAARMVEQGALLKMGMLSQVMGYSTTFLPYQSPPIIFGNELAQIDRSASIKYCLGTAILGIVLVVPINALWWHMIGFL
ncbi:SLC13 family permease [Candidatus Glomeribacter gigasporarum]|uniref:SLC13 family permease n=1 Tax=Candidatus Glomeribacter gigasporarum TaxID=132144 RepID=UPI001EF0DD4D|nr:SLC13 family permease [Candidatus Glomeribacter gigasporarum]